MNRKQSALDRAADRIMSLDDASYGDERERAVFMEATTFGYAVTLYVALAGALLAAVLGGLLLPVVLLVVAGVPSLSTIWYAKQRDVDVSELAERTTGRRKATVGLIVFGAFALTLGAMAWTVFTGEGLVPVPEVDVVGPDSSGLLASLVKGGVIGGGGGLLVGAAVMTVTHLRGGKPQAEPDDED